ncbi:unnamed protein product [Didymodactylos carnosus]|uniref:Uncharacterized protein n=1 Tax=Didymodactylos carnosus TaxID=1234261 RepID=A0A816APR4_9BILA|nr:unnamed protein product [Didymodactylos carnosus]CAF4474598.1 unnamed protein product [Didymodactylos carnosus]
MPRPKRSKSKVQSASGQRRASVKVSSSSESSNDEYSMDIDDQELSFNEKIILTDIGDLAEMCKSKCDTKYLNILLYMSLRYFNIKWEDVDGYLKTIDFMTAKTSHKWGTVFIKEDYEEERSEVVVAVAIWCTKLPAKVKLDEIREIFSKHRAFQNVSQSRSTS